MSPPTSPKIYFSKMNRKRKCEHKMDYVSDATFSENEFPSSKSQSPQTEENRRAHHNELERRRRDHIKDHFLALKDVIPLLEGEKSSRASILKRAVEYITVMKKRISKDQDDIEKLKLKNEQLEAQVKLLEQPGVGVIASSASDVASVPALTQYSRNGCNAGPSTVATNLLPCLNAPPLSIPAATITNPFPLSSSVSDSLEPKLTAFTPFTQSSLLPSSNQYRNTILQVLSNQLVPSVTLDNTSLEPLNENLLRPDFNHGIHSRIIANSQLTAVSAHQ